MLYGFGCSWTAGAELKDDEHCYLHYIDEEYSNYARQGSCLGQVLHILVSNMDKIKSTDTVILDLPPDARMLDEDAEHGFYTVSTYQLEKYERLLCNKTLEWFRYHHALNIYTIQKLLDDIGCTYLMWHTYGRLEYKKYNLPIDDNKFLSTSSMTEILNGHQGDFDNYPSVLEAPQSVMHGVELADGGITGDIFTGIYFEGCENHPNELGHRKIAELILHKIG